MAINMNVAPYNDDFDPNKNFHRILFKPGVAVQARELTQSQTILQNQISDFASSIFSQNTPVSGGNVTTNLFCNYIKLNQAYNNTSISAGSFLNKIITDSTGTILARVVAVAETTSPGSTAGDPPTLIITYMSGTYFSDAMQIFTTDGTNFSATTIGIVGGNTSVGLSSVASISPGVFYIINGYNIAGTKNQDGSSSKYSIGNFVNVLEQTVILNKYDNIPSSRIGLEISETIYDYINDSSLLDPAIGASNFQAPGADRYVITLALTAYPISLGNDSAFIELVRIENGIIVKQIDGSGYSTIDDYFAKRTYDTNGDYIVNPFKLTPSTNITDPTKFNLGISKGIAYVHGYRVENQSTLSLVGSRASTYDSSYRNNCSVDYGTYFYVEGASGASFDITTMQTVALHTVPSSNVVTSSAASYNSTLIGTAKIRNLDFDTYSNVANTSSYIYKASVFDINTNVLTSNVSSSNTSSNAITFYDPTGIFSTKNDAYVNVSLTFNSNLLNGYQGTIVSYNGSTKTATLDITFPIRPTISDNFSINFNIKDIETIVSVDTNLNILASAKISSKGKVGTLPNGNTVLFDSGNQELIFRIGYPYVKSISNSYYNSTRVFRNQTFQTISGGCQCQVSFSGNSIDALNFRGSTNSPLSQDQILKYYTVVVRNRGANATLTNGAVLDFTNSTRRITVSTDSNMITLFSSDLDASVAFTVDIIAKIIVNNANSSNLIRFKKLITTDLTSIQSSGTIVNAYTHIKLTDSVPTNAQVYINNAGIVSPGNNQSLYVSDVKRIVKIIDTGNANTSPTLEMISTNDVTKYYTFSNGQTDNFYDHASIKLKPGAPSAKGNLLIFFDCYVGSGGDGYYDVSSYTINSTLPEKYAEIPTYTATNGKIYQLRDCLDFRPTRTNLSSSFSLTYTNSGSQEYGICIPDNLSDVVCDYSYYLPRKDLLVLNKDKNFCIVDGVPDIYPSYPSQPDGSLLIAKLNLDPYTAYIPGENPPGSLPNLSIETVQHKRWTMQDISGLQTRINNLEYYTALNTLEQTATATQVPDANGLNRFKNGILVDDFSSFSTSDTANPDWGANVNRRTREMSAMQNVSNFPLQNLELIASAGSIASTTDYAINTINGSTNIFTLPYTIANVAVQQLASNTVNVNPFGVSIYQGILDINPPMDNWVDNTKAPDLLIVDPTLHVFQQSATVNVLAVGDWKTVPGTTATTAASMSSSFSMLNHGAFNGPFGSAVGYTQTDTATTTSTYGTLSQTNTLGYYSNIGNTYSLNNNYLTDISILPYIRQQQLLITSKGLLVNTPLKAWFDGVRVDRNMTSPDIVELTHVTGTFKVGDTLGYYDNNKFYPIASIIGVYKYAPLVDGSVNIRLYVVGNVHSSYQADFTISRIQNGFFDSAGKYSNTTASGQVSAAKIISVHKSGYIGAVGGAFTDILGSTLRYYRVQVNHGAFADRFGIWGSPTSHGSLGAGKFNFTAPKAGTYHIRISTDDSQSGYIKIDGTAIWTSSLLSGGYIDISKTLTAGTHTFEISMATAEDDGDAYVAVAISGSAWSSDTTTNGPIVLSTDSLRGNTVPLASGTQIEMPGGGLYYVGATQVSLNGIASSVDDFYKGATITFNTVQITVDPYGKSTVTPQIFTSTISQYVASTCTCILSSPVNLSVGGNAIIGGSDTTSFYSIDGIVSSYRLTIQTGGLARLSTDESGMFIGVFTIPPNTFKTGERVFRLDNRLVDTDSSNATTFAEGTFTASGLSTKSQALDFGPSVSGAKNTFTQTAYLSNQLLSTNTTTTRSYSPYDPIAQSFLIPVDSYPNGIFLDSISVFFATKPLTSSSSITMSIVGTLNGYPNGETLDYSIVTLTPNEVNASSTPHHKDPTTITTFKFNAPVYIRSGVLYAFILKSSSVEYNLYHSAQNSIAIPSTTKTNYLNASSAVPTKIGNPPYFGSLFESQNAITWTPEQGKSLMVVINRCLFNVKATPKIPFAVSKQLSYRKQITNNIQSLIDANTVSNVLYSNAGVDVLSDAYNITTTDFVPNSTGIAYSYLATLNSTHGYTAETSVIPGQYGCPSYDDIYLSDGNNERVLLAKTDNSFVLYSTLSSNDNAVSPIISDDGLSLYNIQRTINNLQLSNNQISLISRGTGYTTNTNISISAPDIFGGTQATAQANIVNGTLDSITFTYVGSGYLSSPTITISGDNTTQASAISISEFDSHGGNALCKYFTKKVVLTPENVSQDLRVFYTAYRPAGSNIYVFYKLLNENDTSKFDDGSWQLMTGVGQTKNVYSDTRNDLYEFEVAPGIGGIADNIISYTNNTQTYNSFIQFAIKIVLTTNDNTNVPILKDIRAMALPRGTNI